MTAIDCSIAPRTFRIGIPAERLGFVANGMALWSLVLACALADLVLLPFSGFRLTAEGLICLNPIIAVVLVPVAAFYTFVRFDESIASATNAIAVLIVVTPLLCLFTYLTASLGAGVPLRDAELASLDFALGFDWRTMLAWADRHAALVNLGSLAYRSIAVQGAGMVVILTLLKQTERVQVAIYAYIASALACGAISAVVPALGTYAFFAISPSQFSHIDLITRDVPVADVVALRSGTFTAYFINAAKGIIAFPSFHATLGVLFAWAFWRVRWLCWPALALNATLIAATPLEGSHYLADVLAGFGVAWGSIVLAGLLHRTVSSRECRGPTRRQVGMVSFH